MAILDIIQGALKALGSSLSDVVRTRIMLQDIQSCEEVSLAHGWAFKCVGILPSNTLVQCGLAGQQFAVEIEAEAEVDSGKLGPLRI